MCVHHQLYCSSPVVLLLDRGGQLLVEALQVREAHQQGVPLRPDELLGLPDILHLPILGLKSAQKAVKLIKRTAGDQWISPDTSSDQLVRFGRQPHINHL